MAERVILAVDAGGTSLKYALVSFEKMEILTDIRFFPLNSFGTKEEVLGSFSNLLSDALSVCENTGREPVCVAFSVPGPFDCENGVSLMEHKWPAVKGLSLRNELVETGCVPEKLPFFFLHDVHCFMLGEKNSGKASSFDSLAAVIVGTGLGFGMWKDGKILYNETGGPKYSIFKFPYEDGILEDYVSGRAVSCAYKKMTGEMLFCQEVAALAEAGDVHARAVFEKMGRALGTVLKDILTEYGIKCAVIGGRVSCAYRFFSSAVKQAAETEKNGIFIYPSEMLEAAAFLGASAYAKEKLR